MDDLIKLLSIYLKNPKKFDREVKKVTKKKINGITVISEAVATLIKFKEDLASGVLRPLKTEGDLFNLIKLGKHLIGKEVYRIWSGGRRGKICSKVLVKNIVIGEDSSYLETQANYSANNIKPIIRKLDLSDLDISWFLTEEDCKKAIEKA